MMMVMMMMVMMMRMMRMMKMRLSPESLQGESSMLGGWTGKN